LPPVKIHCSILAEDAIKAAIADYKSRSSVQGHEEETAEATVCAPTTGTPKAAK